MRLNKWYLVFYFPLNIVLNDIKNVPLTII